MLRSAKNIVKGYSSTEVLVRDATANNSNVPDRFLLEELADKSYNSTDFFEIMDMLDKRINDKGKYWRHVLKSLVVLDFLVRFGSENCVLWCKENIYIIKTLREFMHTDESGVDEGKMIRSKAKALTSLLLDDERLKQERKLNGKRRKEWGRRDRDRDRNRNSSRSYLADEEDEDLRRAIEESKITAEEEEARRKRNESEMEGERRMALQLSKEEQELKRLQELQRQQQQQMQQTQQPQIYYDIFGNPITPEEYLQFQQQQALLAQQQQAALQQQQYWALQQQQAALLAQQQQQQQQLYGIQQETLPTGSNNPFARNKQQQQTSTISTSSTPSESRPPSSITSLQTSSASTTNTTVQQPLQQTRTGNKSITDKYSALNSLLATGAGVDTFGNTGNQRIPAQHTQTGTFINSQGTGYRQVTEKDLANPFFIGTQYTGLPSTNIVPSQTGYGFGNLANSTTNNNNSTTLLDL